ncbi:unnamed protein product [Strongylus vulgaris]|uniref:Uncharacterized protein n=1 Tax=Strongylus vulgaris TaxID=40348 RepID=A0A3P7IPJ2_STRVU|nr:unnamed protein product [Strongylus vulgaris]
MTFHFFLQISGDPLTRRCSIASERPSSSKAGTATPPLKRSVEGSSMRSSSSSSTGTNSSARLAYEMNSATFFMNKEQHTLFKKSSPLVSTDRLRGTLQHHQERSEASVENKVKDLLMNAQVEQQRLAKQLSQPPSTYLSTSSKTVRGPPSLPGTRLVGRTPDAQYATIKNEAEEVVSSTTTSIDTSHSGLRPLAPRPSSSQTTRDLAKVVGQIRQKVDPEERRSPTSSTSTATPPMQAQSPAPSAAAQQRSHDILLLTKDEIPLKERIISFSL